MTKKVTDAKTGQAIYQPQAHLPTRSRRPQGLKGGHSVATKEAATEISSSVLGTLAADLDSATEGQNGYTTGNARFLHVLAKHGSSAAKTVTLYGYNYNFGEWAPIFQHDGDGSFSAMAASSASDGTAQMYIFEIAGVDRVAFVSADPPGTVRAAVSSF